MYCTSLTLQPIYPVYTAQSVEHWSRDPEYVPVMWVQFPTKTLHGLANGLAFFCNCSRSSLIQNNIPIFKFTTPFFNFYLLTTSLNAKYYIYCPICTVAAVHVHKKNIGLAYNTNVNIWLDNYLWGYIL